MSFSSVRLVIPNALIAAVLLCGCANSQLPVMSEPHASVVAIDMTLRSQPDDARNKPDSVYFAKIDGNDSLLQGQIILANYVRDSRAYLLNAAPGTYVAVAVYFNPRGLVTSMESITYLSKELVERSKTSVRESELAFMGSFEVTQVGWLDQADEVQVHYRNALSPKEPPAFIAEYLSKLTSYRGLPGASRVEENARENFLQSAKKDLAGSAWSALLR